MTKVPTKICLITLLVLSSLFGGCGDPQGRQGLSGKITFRGSPLPQGSIQFESAEADTSAYASGALIRNGAYEIPEKSGLPPGSYWVRIGAQSAPFVPAGGPPGAAALPETKELIPAEYNEKTTQVIEVVAGSENVFDFTIP